MCKNCSDTDYNCIIVGAGAAGLFYAAADETEGRKLIIEKTSCPGQKLLMSGNGMCNITHGGSIKDFIAHYADGGSNIRTCLYKHSNLELMQFMEHAGVPLMERPDGKIFPASMKAADVLDALLAKAYRNGFAFLYDCAVTGLNTESKSSEPDGVRVSLSDGRILRTRKLVIATGGASYPATGSDGSFMEILKEDLNITVTALKPALAPVFVENYPFGELSGISFDDVAVSCGGHTRRGPMLLTHKGFSGPAILHISQYVKPGAQMTINYLPDRNIAEVYRNIRDDQPANSKGIANYLAGEFGLPKAFAEKLFSVPSRKLSSIGHKELENIVHLMMDRKHTVSGTGGFKEAMVTAGGVSLEEMNLKNMSLMKYPYIHVIGEALDINGDTGGYNLQFAYSSARAAI
ncbi:MAG: aminoacetone oxidase family FAD-binding enzyme [Firmicutes bacterium]|nr:aminoacetone oxidase family FAD-binding enzyme [Bacillota bacterium]